MAREGPEGRMDGWMDGLPISQVPAATLLKILAAYNKNLSLMQRSVIGSGRSASGCSLGSGLLNVYFVFFSQQMAGTREE